MNVNFTQPEEEHEYFSGHNVYDLERGTVIAIIRVTGEVDGASYTFINSIDYYLINNQLRWITGGVTPDNLTNFYVTYTFRRQLEDVLADIYSRVRTVYPNATDSDGTVLRTLLENIAWEFESSYAHANLIKSAGYLNTAMGGDLDNVVAILGLMRYTPQKAVGTVTFTRNTLSGDSYPIPKGTLVSTIGSSRNIPLVFETTASATLLAGDTEVDAPVQALLAGEQGNVVAGAVRLLVNDVYGITGVTNDLGFEDGTNSETDDELRSRTRFRLAELAKGTKASIQSIGVGIDGIKDVIVKDYMDTYLGDPEDVIAPGIAEIMLVGDVPITTESAEFLEAKAAILSEENKAAGIRCDFYVPTIIYCDIDTEPTIDDPLPAGTNVPGIFTSAIENVQNYVNGGYDSFNREQEGLDVGDPLRIHQVIEQFMITIGIVDITDPRIRLTYPETFSYSGAGTQVLTKTSDSSQGNEIMSVTGLVSDEEHTFVNGTDYVLSQSTLNGVTTLTLNWSSGGTKPDNPSDYVVNYRIVDYHTVVTTDTELLRVANVNFYLIIPATCTARSLAPVPVVTTT